MTPREFAEIDTLHELLAVGIADGRAVLADDHYWPNSTVFHSRCHAPRPLRPLPVDYPCMVCLAGGVIARTLRMPWTSSCSPETFGKAVSDRLEALDDLRCGAVDAALGCLRGLDGALMEVDLGHPLPECDEFRGKKEFEKHLDSLEHLRAWLEERGL